MLEQRPLVGWSQASSSPEILETIRKTRVSAWRWTMALSLVFPLGFLVAGLLSDEMPLGEGLIIGTVLGLFMFMLGVWRLRNAKKPGWEGVVIKKLEKKRHRRDDDGFDRSYMEYIVLIKTDQGKKKRIIERKQGALMYHYFKVGDRVRYHPALETYEKYDKSKDRVIYCNVCRTMNPLANDRCEKCNNLLFK
ncbi:MAG: hypothetical protein GX979_09835 [Firmicutes bacterium]|nr:hypothetical protein [Bacillota bacterium]